MNPSGRGAFPLAVFVLLFIEIFSPFASATYYYGLYPESGGDASRGISFADAEPTSIPVSDTITPLGGETRAATSTCFTSEMDAAEVARYQKLLANFQTEQISTLSDEKLRENDPTNQTSQNIQININLADQPIYNIKDIGNLLEYDEKGIEELAKEFGVDKEAGVLTKEQVRAIASRSPGGQDKLSKALGISSQGDIPRPPYDAYKVVLPNGKSVPLNDIMKQQPQEKGQQCLIDRSFIHGKVTFQALLNKDLLMGFDQSKTTVNSQQHITSKQTTAALNSYAGSMVIPKQYERYANSVGQWSTWEMWASLAGSATILLTKKGPNELKEELEDKERIRKEMAEYNARSFGGAQTNVQDEYTKEYKALTKSKDLDQKLLREVDFEAVTAQWRPLTIAIFGASWMGAARIALSASNQILFSSLVTSEKKFKDNYLQIYVNNNNFVIDFRRATDFFGTGKITDWVSDLMEAGAPSKAFETGKIYFIAKDATPEEIYTDSYTSFQMASDGNWQVNMDWKGKSENSLFEDIRKGGDYSSFALYSNNLELGTTLKNTDELSKYYEALAISAPLLNYLLYRKADIQFVSGPVAAIARAGIFDAVVTRLVDPLRFSKEEMCDEQIVDNALTKYKIITGISIAQSLWSVYSPQKGLLASLGTGMKTKLIGEGYNPTGWLGKKYPDFFKGGTTKDILEAERELNDFENEWAKLGTKRSKTLTDDLVVARSLGPAEVAKVQARIDEMGVEQLKMGEQAFNTEKKLSEIFDAKKIEAGKGFTYSKFEKGFEKLYKGLVLLDPVQLGKQVVASNGFRYVSICKDTSYKILAYQKISGTTSGQNLQKKFDQITKVDVGKSLNLSGLLGGIGKKVEDKSLVELLNLRAMIENPYGQLQPEELYYIHLDGATQQWFGVYDKLQKNGCFRECHDSKDGYVCADEEGVTYTDKKTGKSIKLSDSPDRGLLALMMQDLARTLIPNRIISAPLDETCISNEILQVQPGEGGGTLLITDDSCSTIECLRSQLKTLKLDVSGDLSASGFGKVVAVYTTEGRITANEGKIRFLRGAAKEGDDKNETVGVELQAPGIAALEEKGDAAKAGNVISIFGNGDVQIKGFMNEGKGSEEEAVGKLLTIITEKGRIEFDEAGNRLVVALYLLAKTKTSESIREITTSIRNNMDANGNPVPAIAINNLVPKVGAESEVKELNDAVQKVQTDAKGNLGGFQVMETPDKRYTISTDANGNPILTVYDKKTGESKDYQITGPLRKEGNDIIVPTDKGDFKFSLDMQNGQPVLSASGPDGFKELAELLALKGAGGIMAFDPRTGLWYALNGQDIPWNDEFAKRGLNFYNTPDGTRGLVGDNLYAYPRRDTGEGNGGTPFSIPSIPGEPPYAALMLAAIMLGVLAIRWRKLAA
ncbi:MAG TPA: hypothetical protein VJI13_03130 [Candidatus Norongarragalinales archaeon]|nr:hypothetical protein [Candidatus Norongarragalinales archaeon]